jgi:serine protease AprX
VEGRHADNQTVGFTLRRLLRAALPAALLLLAFALPAATSAKRGPEPGTPHASVGLEHASTIEDEDGDDETGPAAPEAADPAGTGRDRPNEPGGNGPSHNEPADGANDAPAGKPDKPNAGETQEPESGAASEPRGDESPPEPTAPPASEPVTGSQKVDPILAAVAREVEKVNPALPLRVLVFGDDVTAASANVGADVRRELDGAVTSVSVAAGSLDEFAAQEGVGFVTLDVPVRPTSETEPVLSLGANFALLDGAPEAWQRGRTGRGVGVAVLDSGVGADPAFGSRLVHVDLGRGPRPDVHGHGTFVAGVLAGSTPDGAYRGVAPGAQVYDVNVSQPDGVYTSDVLAGIAWVLANQRPLNIRVVNLSLAETLPSSYRTNALDAAVERLWRRGVVVVAAAGNLGPGSAIYAPGNDPYVISVGALDQGTTLDRFDDVAASFSATGPTADGFAKPDLLAPGRRIVSLLPAATTLGRQAPAANVVAPGLAFMSGTSFSAPQVAGAAAVLLEQHPGWTADQVKWVLTRTTRAVAGSPAGTLDLRRAFLFRGRPQSANRALRPATGGRLAPDGGDYTSNTWSSNTWSSNTWSSNTWTSNTWSSALLDWFNP